MDATIVSFLYNYDALLMVNQFASGWRATLQWDGTHCMSRCGESPGQALAQLTDEICKGNWLLGFGEFD